MDRPARTDQQSRLTRRHFAVASIASAAVPGTAFARQDATVAPDVATETILDLSSLEGFVASAAREFYLSASNLGELFGAETIAVLAVGVEFADENVASAALTEIRGVVPETLEGAIGSPPSGTRRSAAGDLGDENLGLVLTLPFPPGSESHEVDAGVTIVRKGADVQVIVSVAYADALEQAIALAESIDGRWPSDELLDLVPTAAEVPASLVLRVEAEP